jgi:hypothetical protein
MLSHLVSVSNPKASVRCSILVQCYAHFLLNHGYLHRHKSSLVLPRGNNVPSSSPLHVLSIASTILGYKDGQRQSIATHQLEVLKHLSMAPMLFTLLVAVLSTQVYVVILFSLPKTVLTSCQCMLIDPYIAHSNIKNDTTIRLRYQHPKSTLLPDKLHVLRNNKDFHVVHGL